MMTARVTQEKPRHSNACPMSVMWVIQQYKRNHSVDAANSDDGSGNDESGQPDLEDDSGSSSDDSDDEWAMELEGIEEDLAQTEV